MKSFGSYMINDLIKQTFPLRKDFYETSLVTSQISIRQDMESFMTNSRSLKIISGSLKGRRLLSLPIFSLICPQWLLLIPLYRNPFRIDSQNGNATCKGIFSIAF